MKYIIGLLITAVIGLISGLIVDRLRERTSSNNRGHGYVPRYAYFNPNPSAVTGKAWDKGDCVVRAFCGALDLPWEEVYSDLCRLGAECHDLPNSDEVIERYAKEKGLVKRTLRPQTNISEFAESHDGTYLVWIKRHIVCVKNNKVHDTGDCGRSRMKTYFEMDAHPSEVGKTTAQPKACDKADNVIQPFCGVLGLSWDLVFSDLCRIGLKSHDMPDSKRVIAEYAKEKGLVRKTLRAPMTLSQFAKSNDGAYLIQLRGGLTPVLSCVKDNMVYDTNDYGAHRFRSYYERASHRPKTI